MSIFGKGEQYRCKNFLVIFQLRWSDIFVKTKVILKPSVSVILYLPLNCAKHNITRRKPNITAQQYNLPQANITEKTTCRNKSFFLAPPVGLEPTTLRLTAACSTDWAKEEYVCWRIPIFPGRHQPSIVGTSELNFRVRNGNGWTLTVNNTNWHNIKLYIWQTSFRSLSPRRIMVTRGGIEPPLPAWEAGVLTAWPTGHLSLPSRFPLPQKKLWCAFRDSNPGPTD